MKQSAIDMRNYLKIYRLFIVNSFNLLMSHRFNLLMSAAANILWTLGQVVALRYLFSKIGTFINWTLGDMLLLLAISQIFFYFSNMIYELNFDELSDKIIRGDLDRYLLKPINLKFLISFEKISVAQFIPMLTTVLPLFILAFINRPTVSWPLLLPTALLALLGIVGQYFFSLAVTGLNFFFDNAQGIREIATKGATDFIRVPLDILPGFLKGALTFIIPLAFVAYYPALIIKNGKVNPSVFVLALVILIFFWLVSKIIWSLGLKRYGSNGG